MSQQRHILHVHFHLPSGDGPGLFERLLEAAEGITPRVQPLPPDSADLDVTGALAYFDRDAHDLAQMLRPRGLGLYGVQTTVGSAGNRMLAAMASANSPPGQITEVGHDQAAVAAFLRPRPIALLYGVGPATAATLAAASTWSWRRSRSRRLSLSWRRSALTRPVHPRAPDKTVINAAQRDPANQPKAPITPSAACHTPSDKVAPKLVVKAVALALTAPLALLHPVENRRPDRPDIPLNG